MKTLVIFSDSFIEQHPCEEGSYLWASSTGVDMIKVVYYPPKTEYGIRWEGYYGVPNFAQRDVQNLKGKFLKVEIK